LKYKVDHEIGKGTNSRKQRNFIRLSDLSPPNLMTTTTSERATENSSIVCLIHSLISSNTQFLLHIWLVHCNTASQRNAPHRVPPISAEQRYDKQLEKDVCHCRPASECLRFFFRIFGLDSGTRKRSRQPYWNPIRQSQRQVPPLGQMPVHGFFKLSSSLPLTFLPQDVVIGPRKLSRTHSRLRIGRRNKRGNHPK
jgi:hypothetical protein